MKKTILIVLVLVLGLISVSLASEDTWTRKADMPRATSLHSANVVDGKIYVMGGTDTIYRVNSDYFSTVWMYDPSTDTWTQKADMLRGRGRFDSSVVDGKIYAIGGSPRGNSDLATVEMYDPSTDTWTRKADLPRARCFLSASVVQGKIYVIGGKTYPSENMVSTVEEYNPATDTWTRKADMPVARGEHSASVIDGKIYVIGGVTGTFGPVVSTVEVYDPATDTWTRKADMPTARFFISTSVVNGMIYTIGGGNAWGPSLSMVEVYDPITDTWTSKGDIPTARATHSASVVDSKIYVIGGTLGIEPWVPTSTVEEYDTGLSSRSPDFNGDGIVDSIDMCILVEHWQTDYPLCDIAPPPFGDGIVDVQDLIEVSEHLFEEIYPPELIAYWKLDEEEGDIAYNSIGDNHGILTGNPLWQPESGHVAGALEFDGISNYITTDFVLDPSLGAFSVFAWIKSTVPKKMIISQSNGTGAGDTWLYIEDLDGNLMTGLRSPAVGRFIPQPLVSEFIITDGHWHHVGFVWDNSNRILYGDGIEVAKDTAPQNPLKPADGGLYIGAGKNLGAGTLFSGLIDDVRIYNIALSAKQIAALAQ